MSDILTSASKEVATLPAEPGRAKLVLRDLGKTYGSSVAMEGVDLTVTEGEFVTLLGPSGSGKTTLLMAVAGLILPTTGEVWIDGKQATYAPPHQRDIGMVFQNYALFPHLTVAENIAFPLSMRKMAKAQIETAIGKVLDVVKLRHVRDRLPSQISGGQQQRIALARALVYNPSLILMDEPLGALDKKLREHLQLEIRQLHRELGTTMLYVTHDQEEALMLSDRICLMNEGRIEQLAEPRELYFKPRTRFAADFLGESNFFDGRILSTHGSTAELRAENGQVVTGMSTYDLPGAGGKASLMVRPESVLFTPTPSAPNAIAATVVESRICGSLTKVYARTDSGQLVSASMLTSMRAGALKSGDTGYMNWDSSNAVILAHPGGSR